MVAMRLRSCCPLVEVYPLFLPYADNSHEFPASTSCTMRVYHRTEPFAYVHQSAMASSRWRFTVVGQESKGSDKCSIEYVLRANIKRPGLLHIHKKDKFEIKIFSKPQESVPMLVGPETRAVKKLGLSDRGRSVAAMAIFPYF